MRNVDYQFSLLTLRVITIAKRIYQQATTRFALTKMKKMNLIGFILYLDVFIIYELIDSILFELKLKKTK